MQKTLYQLIYIEYNARFYWKGDQNKLNRDLKRLLQTLGKIDRENKKKLKKIK